MVHFPPLAPPSLWIQEGVTGLHPVGFPHSGIPGSTLAAAYRGLSQLTTPFIAFQRQGIHHAPLVA